MVADPDDLGRIIFLLDRQDMAYRQAPWGTWAQRWIPGVCKHDETRCTHGDERNRTARRCLICGRALRKLPLPRMCFFTNEPHSSEIGTARQ